MEIISYVNALIFLLLAFIHFYWAFGGRRFASAAIPTQQTGEKLFQPKFIATFIVGYGLMSFGYIMLANIGFFSWVPKEIVKWGTYAVAVIFSLRSIGDFKYVGFFKRIRTTDFAKNDTRIYSPLCLYLGVSAFLITWF